MIALPWKKLCANFILPCGENHYGFFLRCPTSFYNRPIFDNETLNKFSTIESIKDILDIMLHCQSYNLRSFIFACQKTNDIFSSLDEKYLSDENFIQAVFIGILSFVLKQKNGNSHTWGNEKYFSAVLGHEKAPLFKFCYEYIMRQITEFEDIEGAYQAYSELVLYDKNRSNNDNDIITLQTYYVRTDSDVLDAISNIERRLEVPEDISFYQYGTIAVYAIIIKGILGCDIDTIKRRLVANLEGQGNKLEPIVSCANSVMRYARNMGCL